MGNSSGEVTATPVLDTILERLDLLESVVSDISLLRSDFASLRSEFQLLRGEMAIHLDRIESMTNQTRAEMLTLRADFREFRTQLKESMV